MNFSGFNRKQPFKSRKGSTQRVGAGGGRGRGAAAPRQSGHWFDGRWYPAAAGQNGPGRGGAQAPGRARSQYSTGNGRMSEPRGYSQGESSFDGGEGDFGLARRIGFRF